MIIILDVMGPSGGNEHIQSAWKYHDATKHSESRLRSDRHYLDWDNQPQPFKIYTTLAPIPLPRDAEQTGVSALSAISAAEPSETRETTPSLADLARLLYFSAGITKKKMYPGGEMYFRAASCTGAMYEFELYLVCGDLPDLRAGVYHFSPGDFALRLLRAGDYRGALAEASGQDPSIVHAPVTIGCAGTYWRNAWKYRARTYRHFGWDNGTLLANMLAMAAALDLPARIVLGFVDAQVNRLLGLDGRREAAFSLVSIGWTDAPAPAAPRDLAELAFPTVPLSASEVQYPELMEIHAASSLESPGEAAAWHRSFSASASEQQASKERPYTGEPIEQVILRRGSTRQFDRAKAITRDELQTILDASTRGVWPGQPLLNSVYLIVNAVEGLAPGAYVYHPEDGAVEFLKGGDFRSHARHLGLDQNLAGDAAADIFFLSDLQPILERLGNRGYRAVQLEAGILGGKMYLAAYAQHLGATGLTFFDDDVTHFFSPHAAGASAIFLIAVGRSKSRSA